jgi:phosphate transport system substrate-binding protein
MKIRREREFTLRLTTTKAMFSVKTRFHIISTLLTGSAVIASGLLMSPVATNSQGSTTIKIDGSSTVFPISEVAAEEFQKSKAGAIKVTVGVSGTGGGFKKFCSGQTDISDASRPISTKEIEACRAKGIRYIELPIAYDAITVAVNSENSWANSLSVEQLKKIWEPGAQGKITNWNQINSRFPNQPLKLYGPGRSSGTFDYFTEAVNGKSKESRTDFTASEDDNVIVNGISKDKGGMGYLGLAYYEANKSKLKAIKVGGVEPSVATVKSGKYTPLARPLFIYVNATVASKPEVKEFVSFYLKNAAQFATQTRYVSLPDAAYTTAIKHFDNKRTGSVFGGKEAIGLTIEELISRDAQD